MGEAFVDRRPGRSPAARAETELGCELLRVRARLHRLDIATALLLTEIEEGGRATEEVGGGLVDARCRRGGPS